MPKASSPALTVARVARLDTGDLFLCRIEGRSTVALIAEDPSSNNERVILVFGPEYPEQYRHPFVSARRDLTATSFGKNYALRLPVAASDWHESAPPIDTACLMLTDTGDVYVRAWIAPDGTAICYIDLSTGKIFMTKTGAFGHFGLPPGIKAFATRWEFLTVEDVPRPIIAFPIAAG